MPGNTAVLKSNATTNTHKNVIQHVWQNLLQEFRINATLKPFWQNITDNRPSKQSSTMLPHKLNVNLRCEECVCVACRFSSVQVCKLWTFITSSIEDCLTLFRISLINEEDTCSAPFSCKNHRTSLCTCCSLPVSMHACVVNEDDAVHRRLQCIRRNIERHGCLGIELIQLLKD